MEDVYKRQIAHETDNLNGELFTDKMLDGTMEVLTPEKGK